MPIAIDGVKRYDFDDVMRLAAVIKGALMRYLLAVLSIVLLSVPSIAARNRQSSSDVYVSGHSKNDGTYVEPHYRSAPNANKWDNYGYEKSQPKYNAPRENPSPSWNTPNPGRLNDSNPDNDSPYGK